MPKFIRIFLISLALIFVIISIMDLIQARSSTVCFKKTCFKVELATTLTTQENGLMNRPPLQSDHGMLFIFPTMGNYSFWMKNMLQSLDILFFDSQKNLLQISANQSPCPADAECPSIPSPNNVLYVLEIPAGSAAYYNFKIGDQWTWDIIQ